MKTVGLEQDRQSLAFKAYILIEEKVNNFKFALSIKITSVRRQRLGVYCFIWVVINGLSEDGH